MLVHFWMIMGREKEATTDQIYKDTLTLYAQNADSPKYAEEAKAKYLKKVALNEEFQAKSKKEVELKSMKSTENLTQKKQPGLQRQRTMKREKSRFSTTSPRLVDTLNFAEYTVD